MRHNIWHGIKLLHHYLFLFCFWVNNLAVCFLHSDLTGEEALIVFSLESSSEVLGISLKDLVFVRVVSIFYLIDGSHRNLVILRLLLLLFLDWTVNISDLIVTLIVNTILSPVERLNLVNAFVSGAGI